MRIWLNQTGALIATQQRLMPHSSLAMTMNIYGDAVTADMREASGKVAMLALNGR